MTDTAAGGIPIPREYLRRSPAHPFDPAPALDDLARSAPVTRITLDDGALAVLVTGFDEVRHVLTDPRFSADRFAHRSTLRRDPADPAAAGAGMFVAMDPPGHTHYRKKLQGEFTFRRMRALEPRVHEIVTAHIDAMLAAGTEADLVPAFALPVPSLVICELLGVPPEDRDEFQRHTDELQGLDTPPDRVRTLTGELTDYLGRLVRAKRAAPGDDVLSGLITQDDGTLTDVELVNIARQLLVAGHETTATMFALGTFALLANPEQARYLREHPDRIGPAVDELLRYLSIVQLSIVRVTTDDVELAGVDIPAGTTVVVAQAEADRDPRHVADQPDRLRFDRPRCPHLAFGHGVHQCLGQQLARTEMTVGFTELLRRLPGLRLAVPADEVPLKTDTALYGVHSLPIAWDPVPDRELDRAVPTAG